MWSLVVLSSNNPGVPLGDEGKTDTITSGQLDEGLLALADGENVGETRGEGVAIGVTDVDDLVRAGVLLQMHELAHTTDIVTASDEHEASVFEFNHAVDLAGLKVKLPSKQCIKYN